MHEFTEGQFWAACKPLFDLLDTTPMHMYDWMKLERDEAGRLVVSFREVVEPGKPRKDWPIVEHGDDPATSEWAYEVNVAALPEGDPFDIWNERPESSTARESA